MPENAPPLAGVKVVDISNFLAGPVSTMFLADFGAEVVKVERPDTGDELRFWGNDKDGVGLMFKLVNRNKQSVTADMRTPLGVEIVKRLAADADIVVENYRKGTLERWGLGYDVLSEINPGLIMVRLTGFGQTGPNSHRPGFGTLAEGYSGYAYITGYADRPPLLPGFGLADESSGLMGAFLAMVALQEKRRSGRGQVVDFAIYEPLFTLLGPAGGGLRPARHRAGAQRQPPALHRAAQHLPDEGRQVGLDLGQRAVHLRAHVRGAGGAGACP